MTNTETRSPFRGRGFIAAAVVVGIIVLAAIVVILTSVIGGGSDEPTSAPTDVTPSSTSPTASADDESVCGLEGFETTNTLDQAPSNDWALVGTVAAPEDPEGAGPGENTDGIRTCYAHTAEGALFMTVNFAAMGTDASLQGRLTPLIAPGTGRDAAENAPTGSASNLRAQVAGFKIASYSTEEATVDLALNYSSGELVSLPIKLVWAEGDWKIQMTDQGTLPLSPSPLENLGGYIPWSGA